MPFNTTATSQTTSTIGCCISMPTCYHNNSELGKLRFNFSDVTSFTATMLASQTTASQNGNVQNLNNVTFTPTIPNASIASGHQLAFFPFNDNFAQDYEVNNEPIFSGELRTQLKNDNILARFYSASISRLQTNGDPTNTPFTLPVYLYGTDAAGAPLNGVDSFGNPYIATISSPLYHHRRAGQPDRLYVRIRSLARHVRERHLVRGRRELLVDARVHAGYARLRRVRATFRRVPRRTPAPTRLQGKLSDRLAASRATAAYYLTRFDTHYPIFTGGANTISFNDNIFWHDDERLGLAYRINHDASLRFSAGSALVPPFLGILAGAAGNPALCTASTCPAGIQPGAAAVNSVGGVNVKPETSFGYDLGARLAPRVLHARHGRQRRCLPHEPAQPVLEVDLPQRHRPVTAGRGGAFRSTRRRTVTSPTRGMKASKLKIEHAPRTGCRLRRPRRAAARLSV